MLSMDVFIGESNIFEKIFIKKQNSQKAFFVKSHTENK